MSRIPIRLRLTLAFTVAMAVVLAAMSFFVYERVGSTLLASIDQSLRGQTIDTAKLDRGRLDLDSAAGGGVAQVLREDLVVHCQRDREPQHIGQPACRPRQHQKILDLRLPDRLPLLLGQRIRYRQEHRDIRGVQRNEPVAHRPTRRVATARLL